MDYENDSIVRDLWNHLIQSLIFQERKHRLYDMRLLNVTHLTKGFVGIKTQEFQLQTDAYMSWAYSVNDLKILWVLNFPATININATIITVVF